MNYCQWSSPEKGGVCVRCGYILRRDYLKPPGRICGNQDVTPPQMGLGDIVAAGFGKVGITKELVTAIIGPCGCDERQEALNELGKKLGL